MWILSFVTVAGINFGFNVSVCYTTMLKFVSLPVIFWLIPSNSPKGPVLIRTMNKSIFGIDLAIVIVTLSVVISHLLTAYECSVPGPVVK